MLATREIFFVAGLFDEQLPAAQDYDMWIRLLKVKSLAKAVHEPTYNQYATLHARVTLSKKRKKGYLQCYQKHKGIMSKRQRQRTLRFFRKLDAKKNTTFIMILTLYQAWKWPIFYAELVFRRMKKLLKAVF